MPKLAKVHRAMFLIFAKLSWFGLGILLILTPQTGFAYIDSLDAQPKKTAPLRFPVVRTKDRRDPITRALFPRKNVENQASLRFAILSTFTGIEVGYRRDMGSLFAVGVNFEMIYPRTGYSRHLSFSQSFEGAVWLPTRFDGAFLAIRMIVGEVIFTRIPRDHSLWFGGDFLVGWTWWLPYDISMEMGAGVRKGIVTRSIKSICTLDVCAYARETWMPRVELSVGYLFGDAELRKVFRKR